MAADKVVEMRQHLDPMHHIQLVVVEEELVERQQEEQIDMVVLVVPVS